MFSFPFVTTVTGIHFLLPPLLPIVFTVFLHHACSFFFSICISFLCIHPAIFLQSPSSISPLHLHYYLSIFSCSVFSCISIIFSTPLICLFLFSAPCVSIKLTVVLMWGIINVHPHLILLSSISLIIVVARQPLIKFKPSLVFFFHLIPLCVLVCYSVTHRRHRILRRRHTNIYMHTQVGALTKACYKTQTFIFIRKLQWEGKCQVTSHTHVLYCKYTLFNIRRLIMELSLMYCCYLILTTQTKRNTRVFLSACTQAKTQLSHCVSRGQCKKSGDMGGPKMCSMS